MAKLRHIALQVPDLEKAAKFYETALEMKRVSETRASIGDAIMLSDGVMNLTLLNFPEGTKGRLNGPDWAGIHHFGFIVDDLAASAEKVEQNGGKFFMKLDHPDVPAETKYKDPMGIVFDLSEHGWDPTQKT